MTQETPGVVDLGYARLDVQRADRTGDPEVVLGTGKTPEQVVELLTRLHAAHPDRAVLATRLEPAALQAVEASCPGAVLDRPARAAAWGPLPAASGLVRVVAAGTSDGPVAAEAAFTARVFGAGVARIDDVGVAGIHRLLAVQAELDDADCLIVVAGMEGALPSVVGGLTGVPVVAVPTSRRLRRIVRRAGRAARHAQLLRARDRRDQHRQRLRGWRVRCQGGPAGGSPTGVRPCFPTRSLSCSRLGRRAGDVVTAAWFQCAAGASGDMLLGALLDVGASLTAVQGAVDAVGVDPVRISVHPVERHGVGASKAEVEAPPSDVLRTWADVRELLERAPLAEPVRTRALDVFARLARAEGAVHRVPADEVHFHEVGALDAIADVVGVSAALVDLGIDDVTCSAVALGSGLTRSSHGVLVVPAPAVVAILAEAGAPVYSGAEEVELCTPTGAAVLASVTGAWGGLPLGRLLRSGYGAGTRELEGVPNLLRVVLLERVSPATRQRPPSS